MNVFVWLVILVVILGITMHGERKGNTKYIVVACLLLFCVYGLRDAYTIGNDSSSSYLHAFQRMEDAKWESFNGPFDWVENFWNQENEGKADKNAGTTYVMKFVYDRTDGNYQTFIIIWSAVTMVCFLHFIRRYSTSPLQSVLFFFGLLFYTLWFNALKQAMAMSFILLAFDGIMDRKLWKFLLWVAVATVFHYPALVFLPAYWIANMKLGRRYLVLLALLLVVVYFLRDQIVDTMTDVYFGEDNAHTMEATGRFLMNKVIVMLLIVVAAVVIRPPSDSDRLYSGLLALMGVAAVLQTFAGYGNIFERLADYYFQFSVVFIPMIFEDVKADRRYLSVQTQRLVQQVGPYAFCAFAIWRFLNAVQNPNAFLLPYHFYFNAPQ